MGTDDKVDIEAEISAIESRARVRRRRSAVLTLVPVILTGALVLVFAYDIARKRTEVAAIEGQKRKLDEALREQASKLVKAEETGEELDAKISKLKEERKELEDYLRRRRSQGPDTPDGGGEEGPTSVVLAAEGESPEKLRVVPRTRVSPRRGGRVFDVVLSLDVVDEMRSPVSVTYELNPVYYFVKRELTGGEAPSFEASLTVYACKSTVLVKIKLQDGSRMEVDYDWCRAEGWPAPAQEQVQLEEPEEPRPGLPPSHVPGIAHPHPQPRPQPQPQQPQPNTPRDVPH
jgi:hypothetical protein